MKPPKPNRHVMIVGPPGCGKTTLAIQMATASLRANKWVWAYDPHRQFAPPLTSYPNLAAFKAAASSGNPLPLGIAIQTGGADLVMSAAVAWARQSRRRPTVLVIDESSAMQTSGATFMAADHSEMLAQRRWFGAGLETIMIVQWASMVTRAWYVNATAVVLYRMTDESAIRATEKFCMLKKTTLDRLAELPDYRYYVVVPGRGFDASFDPAKG